MKILNLYCGIGGNRKNWGDEHQITAVELDPQIAKIYQDFFPQDTVIVADAHQYLLDHFAEFDFIWSSPPCQSHSRVRFAAMYSKYGELKQKAIYPDMKLWQEIIFLQNYFKGKYVVENVIGFYEPFIKPQEISKHYFWTNFFIPTYVSGYRGHNAKVPELQKIKGFNLDKYDIAGKRLLLRNCVEPELGKYIFDRIKIEDNIVIEKIEQQNLQF